MAEIETGYLINTSIHLKHIHAINSTAMLVVTLIKF